MKIRLLFLALTAAAPRTFPVPTDVSPQLQTLIAAPLNPIYNQVPATPTAWKTQIQQQANKILATIPAWNTASASPSPE